MLSFYLFSKWRSRIWKCMCWDSLWICVFDLNVCFLNCQRWLHLILLSFCFKKWLKCTFFTVFLCLFVMPQPQQCFHVTLKMLHHFLIWAERNLFNKEMTVWILLASWFEMSTIYLILLCTSAWASEILKVSVILLLSSLILDTAISWTPKIISSIGSSALNHLQEPVWSRWK